MFAWGPRSSGDDAKLEIERLRAFVEMRAQAQENLMRAMLEESAVRAAEALESRIQLAIGEAMKQKFAFRAGAGHGVHRRVSFGDFIGEPFQAAANIFLARARRDMTVPMGTPVISAISR